MTFTARKMTHDDVAACVAILNHTIELGGTTAHEEVMTEADFRDHYCDEPPVNNVVIQDGRVVGFQAAFDVGDGLYSIGSFTDQKTPARGAGRALFDKTLSDCQARGGVAILAKITADNVPGLAYYTKMGFQDWKTVPDDHTRRTGEKVDRVIKRYPL
ncbi:MAG: GNAT family N-acetyltransferase [Pseudomonadota bacterium]